MTGSRRRTTTFRWALLLGVLLVAFSAGTATASAAPDLSTTLSDSQDPTTAGTSVDYTVTVQNLGTDTVGPTTVSYTLPAGTVYVGITNPSDFTCTPPPAGSGGTVTCTAAGTIPAGETRTFVVGVDVPANTPDGTSLSSTASATTVGDSNGANDSATETTGVQALANLEVTNGASGSASANTNVTYTIQARNAGASNAANTQLTDTLPAGTTFQSMSGPAGFTCTTPLVGATGTVTCTNPSFAAGANATFTLVLHFDASTAGTIVSNTADISSDSADPSTEDNSATASTTVASTADLAVTIADSPDPVAAGNNVTYTIQVTNNGPDAVPGATVSAGNPAGTGFVSMSGPGTCDDSSAQCATGPLASGASQTYTLTLHVASDTTGSIGETATITPPGSTNDPDHSNNGATTNTTVTTSADLAASVTDSPDPVTPGGNITYTINMSNDGPSDAANVSLTDTIPAGTTFVSLSSPAGYTCTTPAAGGTGTVTCTMASLPADVESQTFILSVHVAAGAAAGTVFSNTATASTTTSDPASGNNSSTTTTTVAGADLATSVSGSPDPVSAGNDLSYTVAVQNNGALSANSVSVVDTLPTNATFVSAAPSAGSCAAPSGGMITCSLGTLASGANATITIVVHVPPGTAAGASVQDSAQASTSSDDPNAGNNGASASTTVQTSADLSVTASGTPGTVTAGDPVTYHVQVHQGGPSDAAAPALTIPIPSGTSFESIAQTAGAHFDCTHDASAVTCSAASLASGSDAAFDLVLRTAAPAGGSVTVSPRVSATTSDPANSNNSAGATTTVTAKPVTPKPKPKPVTIKLGHATERKGTGAIALVITCTNPAGKVCKTTLKVGFGKHHPELDPIKRDLVLRSGHRTTVLIKAPRAERRLIRKIRRLPLTVTATRPPGKPVTEGYVVSGPRPKHRHKK
jgi:uncharacterized repeat protein (TIGR01451 family)